MKHLKILFLLLCTTVMFSQQASTGGITVPTGFKITAAQPIDDRMTVADFASLVNLPQKFAGLQTYSVFDDSFFVWTGTTWRELSSGSSSFSLTSAGFSGPSTFSSDNLNIPRYDLGSIPLTGTVQPLTGAINYNISNNWLLKETDALETFESGIFVTDTKFNIVSNSIENLNAVSKISLGKSALGSVELSTNNVTLLLDDSSNSIFIGANLSEIPQFKGITANVVFDKADDQAAFAQVADVTKAMSYTSVETTTSGKWTNNKPIYRRVFTGTSGITGISTVNMNIDKIIQTYGTYTVDGYTYNIDFSFNYIAFSTEDTWQGVKGQFVYSAIESVFTTRVISFSNNFTTKISTNTDMAVPYTYIVEYTKTTD